MALTLTVTTTTALKRKPINAGELPEGQKRTLTAGKELVLESFEPIRNHIRVVLKGDSTTEDNFWYAFGDHVTIREGDRQVHPNTMPDSITLNVPYRSQRNNEINPDGACNVTSLAMVLQYFGVEQRQAASYAQFEDELYDYAETNGLSRHDPHDLAVIVEDYGLRDDFRSDSTLEQIKAWIALRRPVVVHGYFTNFGHIITLIGYDESGFIVHDPYGEWNDWGYDLNDPEGDNTKGKAKHYSYDLIDRLCVDEGGCWSHFISKR
ncbi:MAG: C39 family peptidase [Alkalinema sp. RU_4_3]|nr:C39 family peptidase [Alkalinema sp. RU_4_3]